MSITIDGAGRVVIPKAIRDEFSLVAGSRLEVSAEAGNIILKLADSGERMVVRDGLLVHRGPQKLDLDVAEFIRKGRENSALAKNREA